MQCPNCQGCGLAPVEIAPGLIGAGCSQCSGALLSLIQYRYWADHFHTAHQESQNAEPESVAIEDSQGAKLCPKCSKLMTKYRIGLQTENRIELCAHCDEAWLDSGEWQLLETLDLQQQLPVIFTDAWQKKIRNQRQQEHLRRHYTQLLGDEKFSKIEEFKQWLDKQPQASAIKHYLTTHFDK